MATRYLIGCRQRDRPSKSLAACGATLAILLTRGTQKGGASLQRLLSMQVQASEWDACAKGSGEVNPFLLHAFLLALEESGSAVGSNFLLTPA